MNKQADCWIDSRSEWHEVAVTSRRAGQAVAWWCSGDATVNNSRWRLNDVTGRDAFDTGGPTKKS